MQYTPLFSLTFCLRVFCRHRHAVRKLCLHVIAGKDTGILLPTLSGASESEAPTARRWRFWLLQCVQQPIGAVVARGVACFVLAAGARLVATSTRAVFVVVGVVF